MTRARKFRQILSRVNDGVEKRIGQKRLHSRDPNSDETDYEQRHFVNLTAAAFLLALALCIAATVQLFDRQQIIENCLLTGRKDCVEVAQGAPRGMIVLRSREQR